MLTMTDDSLHARLMARESQAVSDLLRDHWSDCYRVALRWTQDSAAAEDVAQEALVLGVRTIDRLRDPNALRGWLLTIVARRAKNHVRARARRSKHERGAPPVAPRERVAREETELVLEHLGELSPKLREALALRYLQGLSVSEVADELSVPEGTVSSRVRRGLARLRESLTPVLGGLAVAPAQFLCDASEAVPEAPQASALLDASRAAASEDLDDLAVAEGPAVLDPERSKGALPALALAGAALLAAMGVGLLLQDDAQPPAAPPQASETDDAEVDAEADTLAKAEGEPDPEPDGSRQDAEPEPNSAPEPDPQPDPEPTGPPGLTVRVVDANGSPVPGARVERFLTAMRDYGGIPPFLGGVPVFSRDAGLEARADDKGLVQWKTLPLDTYLVLARHEQAVGRTGAITYLGGSQTVELRLDVSLDAEHPAVLRETKTPGQLAVDFGAAVDRSKYGFALLLEGPGTHRLERFWPGETGTCTLEGLPPGAWKLTARSGIDPTVLPASWAGSIRAGETTRVELDWRAGETLSGQVTGGATPLRGRIEVRSVDERPLDGFTAELSPEGQFSLPGLRGRAAYGLVIHVEGYFPLRRRVSSVVAEPALNVSLPTGPVREFVVRDEEGAPVAGATFGLFGRRQATQGKTDDQGRFVCVGEIPKGARLFVAADGFAQHRSQLEAGLEEIVLTKARPWQDGAVTLRGRVTDTSGAPLAGGRLWVHGLLNTSWSRHASERMNPEALTDADGRFAIVVTRGTGKVDLEVARGDFARRSLTLGTLGEPAEVEIELERGVPLRGRIVGLARRAAEDPPQELSVFGPAGQPRDMRQGVGPDGRFDFGRVMPGEWKLALSRARRRGWHRRKVTLYPHTEADLRISFGD